MKAGDIVAVTWFDAVCDTSERAAGEASDLPQVVTWGELLALNDKYVRVAGERLVDTKTGLVTYRSITTIPRAWAKVQKIGS